MRSTLSASEVGGDSSKQTVQNHLKCICRRKKKVEGLGLTMEAPTIEFCSPNVKLYDFELFTSLIRDACVPMGTPLMISQMKAIGKTCLLNHLHLHLMHLPPHVENNELFCVLRVNGKHRYVDENPKDSIIRQLSSRLLPNTSYIQRWK